MHTINDDVREKVAGHNGSQRTWRLPVTNTTLRFTSRQAAAAS